MTQKTEKQEPVAIEYWLQDTMETGRWVTTGNMAKATAEKMLSGEYGEVYPQGRIVETSPPAQRKPLTLWTEAQHERAYRNSPELHKDVKSLAAFKRVAKEIALMYGIKEQHES